MSQCFALTPMTDENLQQAIQFGITSKQDNQTLYQLLSPWMIVERNLKNPYRQKETIFVYTPYLLASIHARDKVEESRVPEIQEIRKAIQEYDGITLIGARLNTPVVLQERDYAVRLVQEYGEESLNSVNAEVGFFFSELCILVRKLFA